MYTANTMSSAFEAMGMSLPYSSTMAAEDAEKRTVQRNPHLFWYQAIHLPAVGPQDSYRKALKMPFL